RRLAPRQDQITRDGRDIGQLHRAFDGGVAREDLLEERRARARHAEDENGILVRRSPAAALGEKFTREDLARTFNPPAGALGIERLVGGAQAIAFRVVTEGVRVLPGVLERLAEREVHLLEVVATELAGRDLRTHRLHVARAEAEG